MQKKLENILTYILEDESKTKNGVEELWKYAKLMLQNENA